MNVADLQRRLFADDPDVLLDGHGETYDCHGCTTITLITGEGATATYSRVDEANETEHVEGDASGGTVEESTRLAIPVDWPYFRVSVEGGTCRVGRL